MMPARTRFRFRPDAIDAASPRANVLQCQREPGPLADAVRGNRSGIEWNGVTESPRTRDPLLRMLDSIDDTFSNRRTLRDVDPEAESYGH